MEKNEIVKIDDKLLSDFVKSESSLSSLNDSEKLQFFNIAKMFQLNPFNREIYCVPYNTYQGRKLSILIGYETYIKRAERSGQLDGWKIETKGSPKDMSLVARITIYRKDWKEPFVHEVYYYEYVQRNKKGEITQFWKSKPFTMLKKVAISQGFRLAFSSELGGMPYTADEMPEEMSRPMNITPEKESMKEAEEKVKKVFQPEVMPPEENIHQLADKINTIYKKKMIQAGVIKNIFQAVHPESYVPKSYKDFMLKFLEMDFASAIKIFNLIVNNSTKEGKK